MKKGPYGKFSVDVDNGFDPYYVVHADKKKKVSELKKALKDADELFLATDEDREGEAIAWHLIQELKPKVPVKRMVFHEITPEAIQRALANTRELDDRLVDAQETRRILDRLYGYEVSPVLWRKVRQGLSAGRVQSVATRLVVERERERIAFRSAEYWDLTGTFSPTSDFAPAGGPPSGRAGDASDPSTGHEIVAKDGRYGPYVTEVLPEGTPKTGKNAVKPRTASLFKSMSLDTVTLDDALKLMSLPRVVGTDAEGQEITAQNGRYGPYLKKGTDSRSLQAEEQLFTITLEEALAIYAQPKQRGRAAAKPPLKELGTDPVSEKPVVVKDGRFGPYVTDGETNATLRSGDSVEEITPERGFELLAEKRAKGPAKKTAKKTAAKKAPAKKTAAKKTAAKKTTAVKKTTAKKTTAKTAAAKKAAASNASED